MKDKIKVIYVPPGEPPDIIEVVNDRLHLERLISGTLDVIESPIDKKVLFVLSNERHLFKYPYNRAIRNSDDVIFIISGAFFICECRGDKFTSLSEKNIEKYKEIFNEPERFISYGGELHVLPADSVNNNNEHSKGVI